MGIDQHIGTHQAAAQHMHIDNIGHRAQGSAVTRLLGDGHTAVDQILHRIPGQLKAHMANQQRHRQGG